MSLYDIEVKDAKGNDYSLEKYKDNVLLIVNTASECGFTPQFDGLEELYDTYKSKGFVVLGFPCNQFGGQEPGSGSEAMQNCKLNYGVSFPMHEKVDVKGEHQHPLFKFLTSEQNGFLNDKIKWNFTKFLIDRDGNVVKRFAPQKKPSQIKDYIEKYL
ncbi:glutathione peroxidase [Staphylococcus massiliensis]|uniref:glutathione peroxidase n=1 Tax=Staphylococcus massiliensis TaxID=555791 RepID=UPI001EDFCD01|nr:glutathione peroxidase [Staphylococcus massiliensis]MCG3412570.1 glutathione peroxidase [Staphylococcus massiliensis]